MEEKTIRFFALIMAFLLFVSCPLSVYASEKWEGSLGLTLYYNLDEIKQYVKDTAGFWIYYGHQVGAALTADFEKFVNNSNKFDELLSDNKVGLYKDDSGNVKGVYTSKEFMAELKALIDQYAKEENSKEENGGFYLLPTTNISDVPVDRFISSQQMRTFRNIVLEKGCLAVRVHFEQPIRFVDPFSDPDHPILLVGDLSNLNRLETAPHLPVGSYFFCANCWKNHSYRVKVFPENDKIYTSVSDGIDYETYSTPDQNRVLAFTNFDFANYGSISEDFALYSATGEMVRVFVSQNAAKNYTVGNRKVYFTENYYNYVPEDLSVSIDDLQKSVDDLQKVIDELLKQIGNDTSEKEIMDLLKQILEELRNQQGSGGGGGTGGGDVNVDIDLSTTNGLLSKILEKVTQIFEKMNAAVEDAEDAALAKIQESLDEIIVQLKKIKRWTAVDTVIDGVDAIADWLDLIRGVLKDAKEGAGSAVTALSSAVGDSVDTMSKKFPFSIPWDILFFVSVLSAEPRVPHFEIPLNIELSMLDITIDYTMELDFSQLQWLSDLSRLLLSMTYAVGLMKMTFGVTSAGKEE